MQRALIAALGPGMTIVLDICLGSQPDDIFPGVGNTRHTGVGNNSDIFAVQYSLYNCFSALSQIVLMVADQRFADIEVIEQFERNPRIFRSNEINFTQGSGLPAEKSRTGCQWAFRRYK